MEITILMILLGLLMFTAILGIGYSILGTQNLAKRMRLDTDKAENSLGSRWRGYLSKYESLVKPLGEWVPRSPAEMSRQERRLVKAGIRRKDGTIILYGIKVFLILALIIVSTISGWIWRNPLLFAVLSIFLGSLVPDLWITRRIAVRTDKIQLALPNALDLAVVCVEAGMGLDQALTRIGQEMKKGFPDLSDELHVLSLEIRAGRKRADALRNMAARNDSQDLKSFVAVLIQTDRFGTSIAQSLRVFSDTMRTTRRLRAEEHAAKMSIKIIPALVLFIFPAMFIVLLGPAVIAIGKELIPAMKGQ